MDWFSIQSKVVQKNSKIVSAKEIGRNYMLHIDKNMPKSFVPRMPTSAASSENAHCSRITVGSTLLDCLLGYARADDDFITSGMGAAEKFRGGYDICTLEFDHCLKPNSKLVYDADLTNEYWLVSYRPDLIQYKPKLIGKIFLDSVTYKLISGKKTPVALFTAYVSHNKAEGIPYTPNLFLEAGEYRITGALNFENDHPEIQCISENISVSEFNKAKQLNASMLSYNASAAPRCIKEKW